VAGRRIGEYENAFSAEVPGVNHAVRGFTSFINKRAILLTRMRFCDSLEKPARLRGSHLAEHLHEVFDFTRNVRFAWLEILLHTETGKKGQDQICSGGPLRDNNILCRFIKPAARTLGLPWVNWRSLRTSHATWLKMAGADVKDAQAQMRHSRSSTTLDIYQQFVPESQQRAVDKLSSLVN
jgi:integrase